MFDVELIRKDFPILSREVNGKALVYLDSGATAQKPERVIEAVNRLHREQNANIHRGVHRLSEEATELYEQARRLQIEGFVNDIVLSAGDMGEVLSEELTAKLDRL